jgi:hypothetical protein
MLASAPTSPRLGVRGFLPANGGGGVKVVRRAPAPVAAKPAPISPPVAPKNPFAGNPVFAPLAQQVINRGGLAGSPPAGGTKTAAPIAPSAPVKGTIARPVAPIAPVKLPIGSGSLPVPIRATPVSARPAPAAPVSLPVGGLHTPPALSPPGTGSIPDQPLGASPSGTPPSSGGFVTSAGGFVAPGFNSPVGLAPQVNGVSQFSIPMGWLFLGGIVLVVFLVARS